MTEEQQQLVHQRRQSPDVSQVRAGHRPRDFHARQSQATLRAEMASKRENSRTGKCTYEGSQDRTLKLVGKTIPHLTKARARVLAARTVKNYFLPEDDLLASRRDTTPSVYLQNLSNRTHPIFRSSAVF